MFGVLRYLTGNPSTDFIGYRKYVIATLPQLKSLDGQDIERSERILALQEYDEVQKLISSQEQEYKGLFLGFLNNVSSNEQAK
jgi:protein TilB